MPYTWFLLGDIWTHLLTVELPVTTALAAVALLGYVFGRRTRQLQMSDADEAQRELRRAKNVAKELEKIAESVRKDLATHRASVARFKDRMTQLGDHRVEVSWRDLCKEAEDVLKPTLKLASQISVAYDEIRQQTTQLMAFTEVRTDPLTGVSNRRALDEMLSGMFALMHRYDQPFSVAIFDIDHFKQINDEQGHLHGDRVLQQFAHALDESIRETDTVARYGGEEFVVIMPHTPLDGACVFAERLRQCVDEKLPITISGGVASAQESDSPTTLLSRADAALYTAKSAGRNQVFRHAGEDIDRVPPVRETASSCAAT